MERWTTRYPILLCILLAPACGEPSAAPVHAPAPAPASASAPTPREATTANAPACEAVCKGKLTSQIESALFARVRARERVEALLRQRARRQPHPQRPSHGRSRDRRRRRDLLVEHDLARARARSGRALRDDRARGKRIPGPDERMRDRESPAELPATTRRRRDEVARNHAAFRVRRALRPCANLRSSWLGLR